MLSRRGLFTFGVSRLVEGFENTAPAAAAPAAPTEIRPPAPRRGWPRGDAGLWAPASRSLPRPANQQLLDLDELDLDLASLPFEDAQFDAVVSTFGPMFSSDGRAAIDELFRVVRLGGSVAFTAWAPLGVVGRLLRLAAAHDPLPAGVPPPLAWGREERLRQELDCHSDDARLDPRELTLRFDSGEQAVERLCAALGPLAVAPRQDELRAQALAVVEELAEEGVAPLQLKARYLLASAVRRPVLY